MFRAALEDRGCLPNLCGDPFSAGSQCSLEPQGALISWELPFRVRPRLSLRGLRHTGCSEMELKCDSGAQNDNESDVLPQGEMETVKTGCCGGALAESLSAPLPAGALGGTGPWQHFRSRGALGCQWHENRGWQARPGLV